MNGSAATHDTRAILSGADVRPSLASWYALGLLMLVYTCNALDRAVIAVVTEPVRREFGATDTQMGILSGLAFSVAFAVAALPIGILIDRLNRVRLLATMLALWSLMTVSAGFARTYAMLVVARMGVGAAEAGGQPAALSLISDLFPASRRATAVGIFYLGSAFGIGLSYWVGSHIAAAYGWRAAFFIAGIPGMLLAVVLILTLREPLRGRFDGPRTTIALPTNREFVKFAFGNRALLHLVAAIILTSAANSSFWAWLSSALIRIHGLDIKEAGLTAGLAAGVCHALSTVLGGLLADRIARGNPARLALVCAVTVLLLAPLGWGVSFAPDPLLARMSAMAFGLVSGGWLGASFGLVVTLAPIRMRGRTSALSQIAANLLGSGIGPVAVGIISDRLGGTDHALATGFAIVMGAMVWASLHYLLAYRHSRRLFRI